MYFLKLSDKNSLNSAEPEPNLKVEPVNTTHTFHTVGKKKLAAGLIKIAADYGDLKSYLKVIYR